MSSSDALLKETHVIGKLYDAESMMSINEPIANGFVVLLGGAEQTKASDVSLAFLALTSGNVLDACLGVAHPSRREDTPATRAARDGKELLGSCATTEKFRHTAVEAYCNAFRVIVSYRDEYDQLNCITRCFRAKKIRKRTERNLRETFLKLAKAVAESR
jgi:hypothetical protein